MIPTVLSIAHAARAARAVPAAAEAAATTTGFPILSMLIVVPLIGAAVLLLLPRGRDEVAKLVGFVFAAITAALSVLLLVDFGRGEAGYQFVSRHSWIRPWGISWHLGVDGISLLLVVLTGILFPIALAGPDERHDVKSFTAWILLLEAGVMGVFLSLEIGRASCRERVSYSV